MKKILSIVLVALLALCMVACGSEGATSTSGYTSGNTEYFIGGTGYWNMKSFRWFLRTEAIHQQLMTAEEVKAASVEEINANGGLNGVNFKFDIKDDQAAADKATTAYDQLFEAGMQVSLGTVTPAPGLEFKNLSAEDNVFFLTPSASGDAIPTNPNGFQMCFADGNQGGVAAQYVNENCAGQTIGVFYKSDDAYSNGIFKQFKENLDSSITT